jgi:hypothetical protein
MTPEQFTSWIKELTEIADTEQRHAHLDTAMESLLMSLGYSDAVMLIRKTERWYA